jgi:hypothetical protein
MLDGNGETVMVSCCDTPVPVRETNGPAGPRRKGDPVKLTGNNIRRHRWVAAMTAAAMLITAAQALADGAEVDGDDVDASTSNFSVTDEDACDEDVTKTGDLFIRRNPSAAFGDGEELTVTVTITPTTSDIVSAVVGTVAQVPDTWSGSSTATMFKIADISTTVKAGAANDTYTVEYEVVGQTSGTTRGDTFDVTVDLDCGSDPVITFTGFYNPVDGPNTPTANDVVSAKAGQAVALKWNTFSDDVPVDVTTGHSVMSTKVDCSLGGVDDSVPAADSAGESGLRWDDENDQFVYAWKTLKSWANTCRDFTVEYGGEELTITVKFTK